MEEEEEERPPKGFLHVGVDPEKLEVVINLDEDRTGHITFSPWQARSLAITLRRKAVEALWARQQAGLPPEEPEEVHRQWHVELHAAFDELIADYLVQHPHSRPGSLSVLRLLKWSYDQTLNPTATGS